MSTAHSVPVRCDASISATFVAVTYRVEPATFCQLADEYVPDGMAFAQDGRAFVCTTISEGVSVVSPEGDLLEHVQLGEFATNCAFAGPRLYVTATRSAEIEASQRTGTFWAVETDATGGIELFPGSL